LLVFNSMLAFTNSSSLPKSNKKDSKNQVDPIVIDEHIILQSVKD